MAVGTPPHLSRMKDAPRGSAIALALVGEHAATPKRHRNRDSGLHAFLLDDARTALVTSDTIWSPARAADFDYKKSGAVK